MRPRYPSPSYRASHRPGISPHDGAEQDPHSTPAPAVARSPDVKTFCTVTVNVVVAAEVGSWPLHPMRTNPAVAIDRARP